MRPADYTLRAVIVICGVNGAAFSVLGLVAAFRGDYLPLAFGAALTGIAFAAAKLAIGRG